MNSPSIFLYFSGDWVLPGDWRLDLDPWPHDAAQVMERQAAFAAFTEAVQQGSEAALGSHGPAAEKKAEDGKDGVGGVGPMGSSGLKPRLKPWFVGIFENGNQQKGFSGDANWSSSFHRA